LCIARNIFSPGKTVHIDRFASPPPPGLRRQQGPPIEGNRVTDLTTIRSAIVFMMSIAMVWGCAAQPRLPATAPQAPAATKTLPAETLPAETSAVETSAPPSVARPAEPADTLSAEPASGPDEVDPGVNQVKTGQPELDEALDFCQVAQDFWQKGDLENALEALDQAYSMILEVQSEDDAKLVQQKEDLRFLISKRILEIYASRHIVVNGNHKAIPMSLNRHVEAEIKRFTTTEKSFFISSYRRSGLYRSRILKALKEAGLPEELSWLPLIESGFKVNALSRARALGLWQFIPSTGYKFGLKRNMYIDERLDPAKATAAAVAYLKELHQIFGDWTTVLAAYNCGEGRVLRVIRSQNVNYLDNFWDLYERLPRETARYVPRFLATLHIIADPGKFGMTELVADPPLAYETTRITRRVHLKNVAKVLGTTEKALRSLNPELRYRITPEEAYRLRVPPGMGEILTARISQIPASTKPQRPFVYHKVRRGESLSTIARRYRTSVHAIASANNIRKTRYIVAGKSLKIPLRGAYVAKTGRGKKIIRSGSTTHRVKSGDSLWILAKRYGTTTRKIQSLNGLRGTNLSIGQVLNIPGAKDDPVITGKDMKTYQVQRGDSPYKIAQRHKMPLNRFLQANRLTPRSKIYPGQTVHVE
jgi:peptidoglycan lytic transglycosylase D